MSEYVVVIFGGPAEGYCDLDHCPMEAFGPFTSNAAADLFMETCPDSFRPHKLRLSS